MGQHLRHVEAARQSSLPTSEPSIPPAPDYLGSWSWRSRARGESVQDWATRVDPQEREVKRRAAFIRKGVKVRVIFDPFPIGSSLTNRVGVVHKPCRRCFSDYVYVRFESFGQGKDRVAMPGLERLAPLSQGG